MTSLTDTLQSLFRRDLERMISEISLYNDESRVWHVEGGIANSAGNLALHIIGNLKTYIGAALGNTGYVRNREAEFSLKDISKFDLINMLRETKIVVESSLSRIPPEQLNDEYPVLVFESPTTTEYMLVHLATHLTYHLGQINYHRRLVDV